jgi:hypothetical protein
MFSGLTVHQVYAVATLIGGETHTAAEQVQKHVAMVGEDGSKNLGLPLVRSKALEVLRRAAAPVIEEHGRERASALGAPE